LRRLFVFTLVLAVLVGLLSIVDVQVRERVQATIARRIEARSPGSHAVVSISSFPFLGHLVASGTVPSLRADVTDVQDGSLRLESVELTIADLKLSRSKLAHGDVQALSISHGQVFAVISQSALDAFSHLPITLGSGKVGVAGATVAAHVTVVPGAVRIELAGGLPSVQVPVAALDVLPCVGSVQLVTAALHLSCAFRTLPGFLAGETFRA
jgi:LmeA-like phospholipid-binding